MTKTASEVASQNAIVRPLHLLRECKKGFKAKKKIELVQIILYEEGKKIMREFVYEMAGAFRLEISGIIILLLVFGFGAGYLAGGS
tara:strand:- start:274 stop:531 length:258 start_codon:yes stop_codon:yes gene_type:complete